MAISGFEGFEKRLELHFSGDDPAQPTSPNHGPIGLRQLGFDSLQQVLHEVQCTVVSALANRHLDSYVLSESSLFVYPHKIIIKTCGTTKLLKSVRPFCHLASKIGLALTSLRYTRGDFIFPEAQPFPHTSFQDEVFYLQNCLPKSLIYKKASVMDTWHVFVASTGEEAEIESDVDADVDCTDTFTVEICMTELGRTSAERFFLPENHGGDSAGKLMTAATGIGKIIPSATICDYAFDPCGYSMNGVDQDRYSTIHVTPEEGFSYASYETVFPAGESESSVARVVRSVERVFRPGKMTVAITGGGDLAWRSVAGAMDSVGMKRRSCVADEFPAAGDVVYQTFSTRRQ